MIRRNVKIIKINVKMVKRNVEMIKRNIKMIKRNIKMIKRNIKILFCTNLIMIVICMDVFMLFCFVMLFSLKYKFCTC